MNKPEITEKWMREIDSRTNYLEGALESKRALPVALTRGEVFLIVCELLGLPMSTFRYSPEKAAKEVVWQRLFAYLSPTDKDIIAKWSTDGDKYIKAVKDSA